ncbi:MAG TPA: hypothetical protein VG675_19825 [Bryobacteraceae bacterium]|nr:hypothetical protein [Bryobacteraceae bacterium]
MKPLHVVSLVIVGAICGAVVMRMAQTSHPATPAPATVQTPVPAPASSVQAATPPPAVAPEAAVPVAPKREAARPVRHKAVHEPKGNPEPVAVAENEPAAPPAQPVQAAPPQPAPAPAAAPAPAPVEPEHVTPPSPPPPPPTVTLKAGTLIPVRLVDGLSTERNTPGDSFTASLDQPLVVDGFVIAERGARVEGRVVASDRGGRVKGVAALAVELTHIRTSDGQTLSIQTDSFEKHAEQTRGKDATKVGIGAALGAAIGAIAGGGKGAAVGAGVGGAAGAGDVALTHGDAATLPSETRINFRLRSPVTVTERSRG